MSLNEYVREMEWLWRTISFPVINAFLLCYRIGWNFPQSVIGAIADAFRRFFFFQD